MIEDPRQLATVVTQSMKDVHLDLARRTGVSAEICAGATFGLGVTMMFECGYSAEQIVQAVRELVSTLAATPDARGAS